MDKIRLRREQFLQSFKDFLKRVVFDGGTLEAPVYVNKLLKSIQNASILQIPVTFGLGKLYNQIGEDFDVVRGSNVWRTNEHRYYEEVKDNRPCIDYSDGFPVLLTQPQSTNFLINSSTLSLQSINNAGIVTDNAAISPEGIQNAAIYETDGLINSYVRSTVNFTSTSTTQLATFSYHVKYIDNQWVRFRTLLFNVGNQVWFDILNGVIGTNDFPLDITPKIEPLKDGWYRISMTREFDFSTVREGLVQIYVVDEDDTGAQTAGKQVALYEPQAEELGYATTPIKTGAAVVTRLADEVTASISTNSINTTEGGFYVKRANLVVKNGNGIDITDGGSNQNSISLRNFTSSQLVAQVRGGGVLDSLSGGVIDILEYYSMLLLWDEDNLYLYVNEQIIKTLPFDDVFTPNSLNTINIKNVEAKTKELRVYRTQEDASKDLPYVIPFDADFLQSYKNFINDIRNIGGITEKKTYTDDLLKQAVNASLVTVPTSYGVGKLFNQSPNDRLEDFDVVRNSDVWRTNKGGILENIGVNVPCIDYTDGFPVLLTQPQSTNLFVYSNDFTVNNWLSNSTLNIASNYGISPDGTQNATRVNKIGLGSRLGYEIALTIGNEYSFSFFMKNNGGNKNLATYYDGQANDNSYTITNEWARYEFTFTATITETSQIRIFSGEEDLDALIWGAQFEELGHASTYIPTSGAVATRLKDEVTGAGSTSTINSEEGVLYVERATIELSTGNYISLSDGSTSNRFYIYVSTTQIRCGANINGINQLTDGGSVNIYDFNKIALVYDSVSLRLYLNENTTPIATLTLTDTQSPNTLTELKLGTGGSNVNTWDKTKELRVYKSIAQAQIDLPYIT